MMIWGHPHDLGNLHVTSCVVFHTLQLGLLTLKPIPYFTKQQTGRAPQNMLKSSQISVSHCLGRSAIPRGSNGTATNTKGLSGNGLPIPSTGDQTHLPH